MHFLAARAEEGNSIIPANQTINSCIKELDLNEGDQEVIKRALFHLHDVRETLWWSDDRQEFALTRVWNLEDKIAKEIKRLADAPVEPIGRNMDAAINEAGNALGIEYTEEQRDAIPAVNLPKLCSTVMAKYGEREVKVWYSKYGNWMPDGVMTYLKSPDYWRYLTENEHEESNT